MTMDGFTVYRNILVGSYSAWHKSVYKKGYYSFEFNDVAPGKYVLVIDNTDKGWERTDFDFVNDYVVFDLKAYFKPY